MADGKRLYRVVVAVGYVVEAGDEHEAYDIATEQVHKDINASPHYLPSTFDFLAKPMTATPSDPSGVTNSDWFGLWEDWPDGIPYQRGEMKTCCGCGTELTVRDHLSGKCGRCAGTWGKRLRAASDALRAIADEAEG